MEGDLSANFLRSLLLLKLFLILCSINLYVSGPRVVPSVSSVFEDGERARTQEAKASRSVWSAAALPGKQECVRLCAAPAAKEQKTD